MAITDPFLTTKSILGLAERVTLCTPPRVIEIHISTNSIDRISNTSWYFENESDWNTIWYGDTPFVPIPVKINISNSSYFGTLVLTFNTRKSGIGVIIDSSTTKTFSWYEENANSYYIESEKAL